jgi:hypothetical protein
MKTILHQVDHVDESISFAAEFFHLFKVRKHFSRCAKKDGKGIPAFDILRFLFALVFMRKNLFAMTREKSLPWGKDTFYRFLSESRINWRRFLLAVGRQLIRSFFLPLTSDAGDRVFVLDDSSYVRDRSSRVELLSRCYDHCDHRFYRGFRMLTLGWSDGRSFLPLAFSLLGSSKEENRLFGPGAHDGRTFGGHMRKEAVKTRPDAALSLLDDALAAGLEADYLLFDSWFAVNHFVHSVHRRGLHVIAMAKDFNGLRFLVGEDDGKKRSVKLGDLHRCVRSSLCGREILGSVVVEMNGGKENPEAPLPVKVVFVRNRNGGAGRGWLALICTDLSLTDTEVVRIYGKRWSVEVFFKACKSVLGLAAEFQTRSYESLVAHTSIVFLRHMMLSFEQRRSEDQRSYGELFMACCEEMEDITFAAALSLLLDALKPLVREGMSLTEDFLTRLFLDFLARMPGYLRQKLGLRTALALS